MPVYFAYGSNMDEAVLRMRCPGARRRGLGRLARHRFGLLRSGYATVRRDPRACVEGVLFDLALSDIAPLDRYEEVDGGLYVKTFQPVLREGAGSVRAMLYVGNEEGRGRAPPTYMSEVIAQARKAGLSAAYIASLETVTPV